MNRKYLATATALVIILSVCIASAETGKAGYAGSYLKLGLGARAAGMGNAFTAIAEGAEGVFFNPAGLAAFPTREAAFTYNSLTLDRRLMGASVVTRVRNQAMLGISWLHSSVGEVQMRDSDRNPAGNMPNGNNVFGLSFAKKFGDFFAAGANLRYLHSRLEDLSAFAIAVDLGAIAVYEKRGSVGVSIGNLGSSFRWQDWAGTDSEYDDKLPIRFRFGAAAYGFDEKIITALDIEKDAKLDPVINIGAEYWLTREVLIENPDGIDEDDEEVSETKAERWFGLRAGYSDKSPAFGGSLFFPIGGLRGGIDYAYKGGKLDEGSYNMLTLRVIF